MNGARSWHSEQTYTTTAKPADDTFWTEQGKARTAKQHTGIVRNKKAHVGIVQHGSNTDQSGAATRHNGDVLPRVLARLALTVHLVVQMGNRLAKRLDTSGGAILATVETDVDGLGSGEASFNFVFDLGVCVRGSLLVVLGVLIPLGHPLLVMLANIACG